MICIVLFTPLIGSADAYHIYLNEEKISLETKQTLIKDTVFVPLREISNLFGAEVRWSEDVPAVAVLFNEDTWMILLNGKGLYKNGRIALESAAIENRNNISMVPVRLIAYIFNYDIVWDAKTNSIKLSTKTTTQEEEKTDENKEINISSTSIMGKSQATAEQMATFLLKYNSKPQIPCTALELAQIYLEEGEKEGVRGDFAFAQSIHETGYFKFGGNVKPNQYNFAGMGSTQKGVTGSSYNTAREGIRAQIQHLKAYASTEPLSQTCVDARFSLVTRGTATRLEDLANALNTNNAGWAYPGYDTKKYNSVKEAYEANQTYGQQIKAILERILNNK